MRTARLCAALLALAAVQVHAADWSDTSVGWRVGSKFAEPFNARAIRKDILNLNHVSGYKYGSNFFNVDVLLSDDSDPSAKGSSNGAQEIYVLYRHTLEWGKATGKPLRFGPVRDLGLSAGFDLNTKDDAGYNSKKRMLVAGPTLLFGLPAGVLNVGLYALWESNAPYSTFTGVSTPRYRYKTHAMLGSAWGIPLGASGLSFEGFANFIDAKGRNEFGRETAPEINVDMQLLYDLGGRLGFGPKRFRVGVAYQFWKNKFGNDSHAIPGATARTPMVKAQYHF